MNKYIIYNTCICLVHGWWYSLLINMYMYIGQITA